MKKVKFLLAMTGMMLSLAVSAQKYHDAEGDQILGHAKSLTISTNGQSQTVTYTQDGKIQSPDISSPSYNANGYMTSCNYTMMGYTGKMTFDYNVKNQVTKQVLSIEGGTISQEFTYNSNGTVKTETTTMSYQGVSQSMTVTYSYQDYDSHGSWIKRTGTLNGQSSEETRTILYW
jgi:hypothetical protein